MRGVTVRRLGVILPDLSKKWKISQKCPMRGPGSWSIYPLTEVYISKKNNHDNPKGKKKSYWHEELCKAALPDNKTS